MNKILIVDDEALMRQYLYDLFTGEGYGVFTVPRGDEVLKITKQEKLDLILLDVQIPGEKGLSLLNRIVKEKGQRVPVVIYSGIVTPELEMQAMEAGAVDVIRKDVRGIELRTKIAKILSAKHRIFKDISGDNKGKILIVDDEEGIRGVLKDFFESKGFRTFTAKNGEEALAYVEREKPSMILLDVMMPGMDGILTLKKIREIDPAVGVVMATGIQDEQLAKEATELGAYAYCVKPFDLQYLELVVLTRLLRAA